MHRILSVDQTTKISTSSTYKAPLTVEAGQLHPVGCTRTPNLLRTHPITYLSFSGAYQEEGSACDLSPSARRCWPRFQGQLQFSLGGCRPAELLLRVLCKQLGLLQCVHGPASYSESSAP